MEKYLCDECKGLEEVVYVTEIETNKPMAMITCPKCGGVGQLDWVEVVTGKHNVRQAVRWIADSERKWRVFSDWEETTCRHQIRGT